MVASCGGINIGLWSDSVIVQWVSQDMEDFDGGVTGRLGKTKRHAAVFLMEAMK